MLKTGNKVEIKNILVSVFVCVYLVSVGFNNTQIMLPDIVQRCLTLFSIFLFAMIFFSSSFTLPKFLIYIILLTLGIASYLYTGMSAFLLIILSIVLFKDSQIDSIIYYYCVIRFLTIFIVIFCSLIGIINNNYVQVLKAGSYAVGKYSFGYNHPNQLGEALGSLLLAVSYLMLKKHKVSKTVLLIIFSILACGIYLLTSERAFLISAILVLVYQLCNTIYHGNIDRFLKKYYIYIFSIIAFLGLGLPIIFNMSSGWLKSVMYSINDLMSSRLSFTAAVLQKYNISLFGNTFDFSLLSTLYGSNYAVDNGYIMALYNFGLVSIVIYIILTILLLRKIFKNELYYLGLLILILSFWSIYQSILLSPAINFSLLLWGYVFNSEQSKTQIVNK